jgi:hypothetical protein
MATAKTPARSSVARKAATRRTPARPGTTRTAKTAAHAKPSAKPAVKKAAKPITAKPVTQAKPAKVKKPKLVRDSFTIPKAEYEVIHALKTRSQKMGHPIKKSELLRAGIKLLATLSDAAFKAALAQVPVIKTGRPKSAK